MTTTEERLNAMLDKRDAKIARLEGELQEAREAAERNWRWTAHVTSKSDPSPDLPVPRLELRWEAITGGADGYTTLIRYDLVYRHLLDDIVRVPMGSTRTDRNGSPRFEDGEIDLPYRDGAHILHDAAHLGLPAFAIADGVVNDLADRREDYKHQVAKGVAHRQPSPPTTEGE